MSAENKVIARRFFDAWNDKNPSIFDELYAAEAAHHDPANPDVLPGPRGQKALFQVYTTAFPDTRFTIDDIVADENSVVVRWTARGTHMGPLRDLAPTAGRVTVEGVSISRISGGKIVESWAIWDALGMMHQLGAVAAAKGA